MARPSAAEPSAFSLSRQLKLASLPSISGAVPVSSPSLGPSIGHKVVINLFGLQRPYPLLDVSYAYHDASRGEVGSGSGIGIG